MNIAIVDDSLTDRRLLCSELRSYFFAAGQEADITEFASAEELFRDYRPLMYTVIFMDIYMDGMNGAEAAAQLRKTDRDTLLVFLTTSGEHRPEAFSAHAYDYIQKPIDRKRLSQLMDDIMRLTPGGGEVFSFVCDRNTVSIPFSELTAVRSDGHYLEICDRTGNNYRTRLNFSAAEEQLAGDSRFLLVLRGVLVNMDHILNFAGDGKNSNYIELAGGMRLPVNVRNSRRLEQIWKNYVFAKVRRETMNRSGAK